jgi:hypothetical protein
MQQQQTHGESSSIYFAVVSARGLHHCWVREEGGMMWEQMLPKG